MATNNMYERMLLIFPGWVLYRLMLPFLSSEHSLKAPISLRGWASAATPLNRQLCVAIWLCVVVLIVVFVQLLRS